MFGITTFSEAPFSDIVSYDRVVIPSSVSGTSAAGSLTITADASTTVTGVAATGSIGTTSVLLELNVPVTGVVGTTALGTATAAADADVSTTGVAGTSALGSLTIVTVQFNYEAVKENYARNRTDYVRQESRVIKLGEIGGVASRVAYVQEDNPRITYAQAA